MKVTGEIWMRHSRFLGVGALVAAWVVISGTWVLAAPIPNEAHETLLQQYCITCHNGDFVRGTDEPQSLLVSQLRAVGLSLDDVDVDNVAERPDVWEKVVHKLRSRTMPPARRPQRVPP